jgi:DNA-binding transcriptional LysR family regulator
MEISALQAFVAVAESASFSQAAQQLFLTQPAISKRIAALERELGTALFDRVGRHVDLTEAGRALLPRARQILEAVEDSRRTLSNLSGQVEGPLRFGTSHHIGLHRLPPVLRAYSARYPAVRLDIRFLDSEAACQAVERGEMELGVVTLPLRAPHDLRATPIWHDPMAVVAAPNHPLAGRPNLEPGDLAPYPAVLPARGTYTREIAEAAFERFGVKPAVSLSTNYLETIKMLVSVGLGWSILPVSMVDEDITVLSIASLQPVRTLGIVEHTGRTLSNAAQALKSLLGEYANTPNS